MAAPITRPPPRSPAHPAAPRLDSIDPATGDVIAQFELTLAQEIPQVFERARQAQAEWSRVTVRERCAGLARLRNVLFARRQEIAEVITRESGKPHVESLFAEILLALDTIDYYARRTPGLLKPERVPHHNLAMKAKKGWLHYEPWGVIGIISPWNYPLAVPMGTIVPAIAAGNAVVLKPSELTPWCGSVIGELLDQAGFPPGLLQVIQGGGEAGAAMIAPGEGRGPDKVVFTGSVATGKNVAEACARNLIPCVLELGGKDAMIVLADADLEIASSAAVWGGLTNCGQACLSVERIYVDQRVVEKFTNLCVAKVKKLKLGNGLDADVEIGPMIRPAQVARLEAQLADAVSRGARVLTGGKRRSDLSECYFDPTVLSDVNHSMLLMREETFGPVLAIQSVISVDEAVRLANDSEFGLGASVWTRDTFNGKRIAARLNAGAVQVNDVLSAFGICEAPHGGRRTSGWGRSHGRHGFAELVQVKYVDVDRLPRWPKSWWFGYSEHLAVAADRFLEAMFAPARGERFRSLRGALKAVFRKDRV
jgi:succinate-semialdehyde dehydrogenase/glutarate-semialdehyde dehydrogenase